jgi:hypothetical protein
MLRRQLVARPLNHDIGSVRPGGLIIVDDSWTPPVRTAVRYYELNLGWTAIPGAFAAGTTITDGVEPGASSATRCNALRLPAAPIEPPFESFHPF